MAKNTMKTDQGWSWVVLVAAFLCNVIFDGIIYSFGVLYMEILPYFEAGASPTAWIGSVLSGTYALVGPISSALTNRFGCRAVTISGSLIASIGFLASTFSPNIYVMIVTYGIITGFGFGLMYLCAYVMIGYYFDQHRALATGIASCGSGVGTLLFAPLTVLLISEFGWKGATWILAGVILNGVLAGMTFRPVPKVIDAPNSQSLEPKEEQDKPLLDWSLLLNPTFILFCTSSFLCLIGLFVPFMYLPAMACDKGVTKRNAALLLSVIGITNTAGRIICGYISDKPWASPLKIYNIALIVGGVSTALCTWSNSYIFLVGYAAIFGICIAVYVSLCAIILVEFLGLEKLSNSFGFLNMFRGIATFIGAPLSGLLFDITQEYTLAFYVAGITIATAGVICLPLRIIGRCHTVRDDNNTAAITLSEDELDRLASKINSSNLFCSTNSLANISVKSIKQFSSLQDIKQVSTDTEQRVPLQV